MKKAIAFGYGGYVDLDISFGEFFFDDHTILWRFMPQYPYAYAGPMLAENGIGTYMIGQGDYRWGSGGFFNLGPSVLFVQVGSNREVYEVPGFNNENGGPVGYRNMWQHLAVVRVGNTMQLYLNGQYLNASNQNDLIIPANSVPSASSTLRLGRRSDGDSNSNLWQFHGLLNDVSIFNRALSSDEIFNMSIMSELSGQEQNLLAYWNFDNSSSTPSLRTFSIPTENDMPEYYNQYAKERIPAYLVRVSDNKNNITDAKMLDIRPAKVRPRLGPVGQRLPFPRYETWKVVQGWEDPDGSHNGNAAFSWDFIRAGKKTCGEIIQAALPSKIFSVVNNDPIPCGKTGNRVRVEHAPFDRATYLHLEHNTVFDHFPELSVLDESGLGLIPNSMQPNVQAGDSLGQVADHLHYGCSTGHSGAPIPVPFSNYLMSKDKGKTWSLVKIGIPKAGEWVRRALKPTSKPALSSWQTNRLDMFVRVENDNCWHKYWNGSNWSAWRDLGGTLKSAPAAVSWGPNRIDVFVRGENNHLWQKYWNGKNWSEWKDLGGELGSEPTVASWSAGRLDVFVKGVDNRLWQKYWNGSNWSAWRDLGGTLKSAPGAVSWGPNRIDVFVRGENNHLWQKYWNGNNWSEWKDLGGQLTSGPSVSSRGANHLDVFVRGENMHLWSKYWVGSYWKDWRDHGGTLRSAPASVSWEENRIDVCAQGQSSSLWQKYWNGNWSSWRDIGD